MVIYIFGGGDGREKKKWRKTWTANFSVYWREIHYWCKIFMIRFQFQFNLRAISSLLLIKTLESTDRNHFRVCFWSYLCSHQKVWLSKEGGKQELFRKIIKLDRQQQNPMKPVNFINYLFIFYSTLSYQNSYDSSCGKKAKIYLYNVIHCINGEKGITRQW